MLFANVLVFINLMNASSRGQYFIYNIKMQKTKTFAFVGKYALRTKITLDNKSIEQVSHSAVLVVTALMNKS